MRMEAWVPLFDIFLNSPTPELEASLWLQHSFDASAATTTITPSSFLSLLFNPSNALLLPSSSTTPSSHNKRIMWIQTLPNAVQSRILSFLNVENQRFCARDLSSLAINILRGNQELDFWVKKAAHNLLDTISDSNFDPVFSLSFDGVKYGVEEEFEALPSWLKSATSTSDSLLPWLPVSPDDLRSRTSVNSSAEVNQDDNSIIQVEDDDEEEEGEGEANLNQVVAKIEIVCLADAPIDPEIQKMAACLKSQLLVFESTSKTVGLANEIQKLCFNKGGGDPFAVLGLIEPWQSDDETASILLSHLLAGCEEDFSWPSQVLCSVILPKLLVLREPTSRVLVTAIIEYCKIHQRATVDALLFPLILHVEGINTPICDVVTRIIRECLHPAHVSAFFQKLLCGEKEAKRFVCLPYHECLIANELVWTEPLFTLLQNVLNHNVYLTQDSVDHIVSVVQELAERFSKSLKFTNFLLCFVTKCAPLLKSHKLSFTEAVERTNTFMTNSILSKLAGL